LLHARSSTTRCPAGPRSRSPSEDGFVGVAYANFSLDGVADLVKGLDLGEDGWAFLASRTGALASWPDRRYVTGRHHLSDVVDPSTPGYAAVADWLALPPEARQGQSIGPMVIEDPFSDAPAWLTCRDVPSSGWSACTLGAEAGRTRSEAHELRLAVAAVCLVVVLGALVLDVGSGSVAAAWALSGLVGLACCTGIGWLWRQGVPQDEAPRSVVFSDTQIRNVVRENTARGSYDMRTTCWPGFCTGRS
jgi:hypothetical protein